MLYTPAANYNGSDSFSFTATGPDGTDTATASITITAVNDAPVCAGDASSGNEDTVQTGTVACTDVDSGALTYSKVAGPAHGSATVNTNGSWTLHAGRELQRRRQLHVPRQRRHAELDAPSRCP